MEPGSQVKKPRKKVCPRCKRKLWLRDFYVTKATGQPHRYCKECSREIYWDGNMLSVLRRHFPNTRNEEVAEMLGVSPRTVVRKARELGIYKDPDFCIDMSRQAALLAYSKNKREGWKHLFQKGMIPWNKGKKLKTTQLIEPNEKETIELHHPADTLLPQRRNVHARTQHHTRQ